MSTSMQGAMMRLWADLRHAPTEKRVRAMLGDSVLVDTIRALLVWEPRRVTPVYAVPVEDVRADLISAGPVDVGGGDVLHPGIPFAVHSAPGEALTVSAGGHMLAHAAFRPSDPELAGYVVLDFDAFDRWLEEDEPVRAHPRDPYHRVDVRASSRHVRIAHEGRLVADTKRPSLPGPFPDRAASLLPGLLAATRTGLTPAGDDELTNHGHLHEVTSSSAGRTKQRL